MECFWKSHICEGEYEEHGARLPIALSLTITFTFKKTALLFTLTDDYMTKMNYVYYFMKKEKSIFVTEGYLLREVIKFQIDGNEET